MSPSSLSAAMGPRAPFRVLYGNDATNITSCVSPWHPRGAAFAQQMLEATVEEVASTAVDAHLLQPGLGAIPWWPSDVCPLAEHFAWIRQRYGLKPDSFARYLLAGGDLLRVFIDRCRKTGQSPFVSFRLNDVHAKQAAFTAPGKPVPNSAQHALSRFYVEHPEYRLGTSQTDPRQLTQNFAIEAVRRQRLDLLEELCAKYDFDGLELDFMRHPHYFQLDKTTSAERAAMIAEFVGAVRRALDRAPTSLSQPTGGESAPASRRRWLGLRVPALRAAHDALGLDLAALARAGVDMFNLSSFYFTEQQTDAVAIARELPDAAVYLEMTQATRTGPALSAAKKSDNYNFRRTTDEQFYTTAHAALARGLAGVSLFNFAYYREHGPAERGPFCEPPFHVLQHLADADWLARQPQHWFLAQVWDEPPAPRPLGDRRQPFRLAAGETARLSLDLVPPSGGWRGTGKLRLETRQSQRQVRWSATLNGAALAGSDDLAEPYPNPPPALLPAADCLAAWTVPREALRDGANRLELRLDAGGPVELLFLDLAIS